MKRQYFLILVVCILLIGLISSAFPATIADRVTSDPLQTGYARWIRITVQGEYGAVNILNDNFNGVTMIIDLNLDGDDNWMTPSVAGPSGPLYDVYEVRGSDGDLFTNPPGLPGGNNDQYFFVPIRQGDVTPFPDGVGYDTNLLPRIKLVTNGQLRIGTEPLVEAITPDTDYGLCNDSIKPLIRTAFYYDDGSGGTALLAGVHPGNRVAFDGFIDRIDLIWSEPMDTSNHAVTGTMFMGLGPTVYGLESLGYWYGTKNRFTFFVVSSQANTGIAPILQYNRAPSSTDRFREAPIPGYPTQIRYEAEAQSRAVGDKAGPCITNARTMRAKRRQPEGLAMASKLIEATFSEPILLSTVARGDTDLVVMINGSSNRITTIISPTGPPASTSSATFIFQLTNSFTTENDTGRVRYADSSVVRDISGNWNGISTAPTQPSQPTPGPGAIVIIVDGILPNITRVATVDAALPGELASGGSSGWGVLDYVDVTFDHRMNIARISTAGFNITGMGISAVGGSGMWINDSTFRVPMAPTNPKIPNTGIIPVVSYTNPGNPNGLQQNFSAAISYNSGLAENLLTSDIATSATNGLAVVIIDNAGPAIVLAYTAGSKRIRISFSERIDTRFWPTTVGTAAWPTRFKWIVGSSYFDLPGTKVFFTGLSSSRKDSVIYLNHTGLAWAKTDSGAINFFSPGGVVMDWAAVANGNAQCDDDNSLSAPAHVKLGSDVKIARDNIAPILLLLATADLDLDGKIDHYRFVFDQLSPIFPRRSFNPAGWSMVGYDGAKTNLAVDMTIYNPGHPFYQPSAINAFGDTVEAFVKFDETTGNGPASTPYGGDTGDVPDVVVGADQGFGDWADNIMVSLPVGLSVEQDNAGIALMFARTINTTQVEAFCSEDADGSTVHSPDFALIMEPNSSYPFPRPLYSAQEVGLGKILLTVQEQSYWKPEQTGILAFSTINVVMDNVGNGNMQTFAVNVIDNAGSRFEVRAAVPGDQIRGVPFQVEVIARDSWGNVDTNFIPEILLSANQSQNEIDMPDGPQELINGVRKFWVTSYLNTDNLRISAYVYVSYPGYLNIKGTSDSIKVVDPVIDEPDTLIVQDFPNDQGGYVRLLWNFSDNHRGFGNLPEISYYELFYEIRDSLGYLGGLDFIPYDTSGTNQDFYMTGPLGPFPADSITFYVRAVWDPNLSVTQSQKGGSVSIIQAAGEIQRILVRSLAGLEEGVLDLIPSLSGDGDVVVSGYATAEGRAIDNIVPLAPENLLAEKEGVATKLHWSPVRKGVDGTDERPGNIRYEIYSHDSNAYFNPIGEGTLEATITDTLYVVNTASLCKFFCVYAVDSDNKSEPSERVGKYGFQIKLAEKPKNTHISLPLEHVFANAKQLSQALGENIDAMLKLSASTNAFSIFYLPEINFPSESFTLYTGAPVLVQAHTGAAANWFYTGDVPSPQTLQFAINKGAKNKYNEIILPLDRTDIINADQLAQDIGGVEAVLRIGPDGNGFSQYWLPSIQFGNYGSNPSVPFPIMPGEPVLILVNKDAPTVWPAY